MLIQPSNRLVRHHALHPPFDQLPPDLVAAQQTAMSEAAVLFAVREVAYRNGNTLHQQAALWRPFR